MQRIIIDCKGETQELVTETIEELTPDEVMARLLETEEAKKETEAMRLKEVKQLLLRELIELREMVENKDIFDDKDIKEKQAYINTLKEKLTKT